MDTGPYSLFDDENFGFIFQTCVHFIGCVNLFEENDKETGKHLTTESLLTLRRVCQNCLDFFDTLHANMHNATDAQLNLWVINLDRIMQEFKQIMDADIKELDDEAKNSSLPNIVKRLEYFIKLLIFRREKLNEDPTYSHAMKSAEITTGTLNAQEENKNLKTKGPQIISILFRFNDWLKNMPSSSKIFNPPPKESHEDVEDLTKTKGSFNQLKK